MEKNDKQYELIITILNQGFAEKAMDAARKSGATGGTILTARGTATKKLEKKYNLVITPEKEILLILSDSVNRNNIMKSIIKNVGLETKGKGIAFSVPVDEVLGLTLISSVTDKEVTQIGENKYGSLYVSTGSINENNEEIDDDISSKENANVVENELVYKDNNKLNSFKSKK